MHVIGWKPVVNNFSIPSARIRCLNIIRNFQSDTVALEVFNECHFADRYDAVIFSKNYSEESLQEAQALKQKGKKVVFDIFDNRFFDPDGSAERKDAERRLKEMFRLADYITTSTDFLKATLSPYVPGREITVIEEALEDTLHTSQESQANLAAAYLRLAFYKVRLALSGARTRLIWFGTSGDSSIIKSGGMSDILKLKPLLSSAEFRGKVTLTVCSNGEKSYRELFSDWPIPTLFVKWHPATFYRVLKCSHVALIPVTPNPLTICKSNNRVVTALYNGLAVIADEIPSYAEFGDCIALNDWEGGLRRFVGNEAARRECVEKGRAIIARKYTPRIIADKWRDYLTAVLRGDAASFSRAASESAKTSASAQ